MNLMPDLTIVPMWFLFIMSFVVLNQWVFKPTLKILKEREKLTVGHRHHAQENIHKAQAKLKTYETVLNEARQQGRKMREELIKKAQDEQKEALLLARQKAESITTKFKNDLEREITGVRQNLKTESETLADEIVKKLVA